MTGIMFFMRPDQRYIHDRVTVTPDGCWLWNGYINDARGGYGTASWKDEGRSNTRSSHKLAYEIFRGPVPSGLELDHAVCQQKICCNPHHLEAVTKAENSRRNAERGVATNRNAKLTSCTKCGKPFDMVTSSGRRTCRSCVNAYYREWRARKKEKSRGA
jgi:hypothetical protein